MQPNAYKPRLIALRGTALIQPLALFMTFLLGSPIADMKAAVIATQTTVFTPNYPTTLTNVDILGNLNILPTATVAPPSAFTIISTSNKSVSGQLTVDTSVQTIATQCTGFVCGNNPVFGYTGPPPAATAAACTPDGIQSEIVQCRTFQETTFPAEWETNALTTYVLSHGLPASDAAYIYQYGRADLRSHIRGFMLSLIVGIINKPAAERTTDEAAVFAWLTQLVYSREIAAATDANNEYQTFVTNPCAYQVNQTIVSNLNISNSAQWCPPNIGPLGAAFETSYYPPLSYFQAVGEANAYAAPLGAVGTSALTIAQSDFLHSTFVATQGTPASQAQYAAFSAAAAGVPAGAAIGANYDLIAPQRVSYTKFALVPSEQTSYVQEARSVAQTLGNGADPLAETTESVIEPDLAPAVDAVTTVASSTAGEDAAAVAAGTAAADAVSATAAAASAAAFVVAVVALAVVIAVQAGEADVSAQQNEQDDKTLPQLQASAQSTRPDLTQMIQTGDGYLRISEAFIQATLPDYPSTVTLPAPSTNEGFFLSRSATNSQTLSAVTYLGADGNYWRAQLWNNWLIGTVVSGPNAGTQTFGLDLQYTDLNQIQRRASRMAPNLWEVEPLNFDSNAPFCQTSPTLGVTDPSIVNPYSCASAVVETLNMQFSGTQLNTTIALAPTITSSPFIGTPVNQAFSYEPTYQNEDPLNVIPCTDTISGNLPTDITNSNGSLTSQSPYNYTVGTYPLTVSETCGGVSTNQQVQLNVASKIQFTSSLFFPGTVGVPFKAVVSTSSNPIAKLTLTSGSIPPGLTYTDNGNGTGTFSGTPTATYNAGGCSSCAELEATNGESTLYGGITFDIVYNAPVFTSPAPGATIHVVNADTLTNDPANSINVSVANANGVKLSASLFTGLGTASGSIAFKDNGNGTGTLTYNNSTTGSTRDVVTLLATPCCGLASVPNVIVLAGGVAPYAFNGVTNGPAAFVVGMPSNTSYPVKLDTNVSLQGYNPFHRPNITATGLPKGLSVQSASATVLSSTITGTPAVGTGGLYHIPVTTDGGDGITPTGTLNLAVYEPPSFPIYTGANSVVFRNGTASSFVFTPTSGFPIGPFNGGPTLGASSGISYALNPTSTSLTNSPISITSGLGSSSNGNLTIAYDGHPPTGNGQYTLNLISNVTTGPVPGFTNASESGTYGTITYTDQAYPTVDVVVAPPGDANLDGQVSCADLTLVRAALNQSKGMAGYSMALDMNNDGVINIQDVLIVTSHLPAGTTCH